MRRMPIILAMVYLVIFTAVLVRNLFWPAGDQTDVIRAGIAAFPFGLVLSFFYPGGRNGAFVAVSMMAVLNAVAIYCLSALVIRRFSK